MNLTIEDLKKIREWHKKQITYLDSIIKRDTVTLNKEMDTEQHIKEKNE